MNITESLNSLKIPKKSNICIRINIETKNIIKQLAKENNTQPSKIYNTAIEYFINSLRREGTLKDEKR